MDNRSKIINNLKEVRSILLTTLVLLDEKNQDGKQFDYYTSPKLSDNFDAVNRIMQKINKIIYQED